MKVGSINPEVLLHRGWSYLEADGIWSTRRMANVLLDLPKHEDLTLRVELTPFVPRATDRMKVQFVMNGHVVFDRTYIGKGVGPWPVALETVKLPSSIVRDDGLNVLEFKVDRLLSPTKIGIPDQRLLGIMLKTIGVE